MKYLLFLPFALLLGLVIGGWGPREELRAARKEISDLNRRVSNGESPSRLDTFARIVKIPDRAPVKDTHPKPLFMPPKPPDSPSERKLAQTGTAATNAVPLPPERRRLSPRDLRARIDEAKELWKTRVDVARAQWIQRLKLSTDETARFDDSINAMNEALYASMQGLADALAGNADVTPELGTRFLNEMTETLVSTYDNLSTMLPEDQQAEAAQIELTDFIDPAVAEPLISVQSKLDAMPAFSGSSRRRASK